MAREMSRKQFRESVDQCFSVGYCDIHYLLYYKDKRATNHGVYGWNWSGYTFLHSSGIAVGITTGYRNTTGKRIPYDLAEEYNRKAREIVCDRKKPDVLTWEEFIEKNRRDINNLLDELITKAIEA